MAAMIAASAAHLRTDAAVQYRLDRSQALHADLEQIWARERAELVELGQRYARRPVQLMFRRARVILRHWSEERKIYDELTRLCGTLRLAG
jgi:hypothetical protein